MALGSADLVRDICARLGTCIGKVEWYSSLLARKGAKARYALGIGEYTNGMCKRKCVAKEKSSGHC